MGRCAFAGISHGVWKTAHNREETGISKIRPVDIRSINPIHERAVRRSRIRPHARRTTLMFSASNIVLLIPSRMVLSD